MPENEVKILLVEDDQNLGTLLCEFLNAKGFAARLAKDGREGLNLYSAGEFDLCIFDVMMPVMDGFTLAQEIRRTDPVIPIIFLTAKSMKEDTIRGFRSGGDDYLTKPFSMEELLYRIRAVLKRVLPADEDANRKTYQIGRFTFDANSQTLQEGKNTVKLTSKESHLLAILCMNRNQTVQRDAALKAIWGDDTYFNARSMDVYISKLRKHFRGESDVEIVNIHGRGFKLVTGKGQVTAN